MFLTLITGVSAIDLDNITFTNEEFYNGAVTATEVIELSNGRLAVFYKESGGAFKLNTCDLDGTTCDTAVSVGMSAGTNDLALFDDDTNNRIIMIVNGYYRYFEYDLTTASGYYQFNSGTTNYQTATKLNSTDFVVGFTDSVNNFVGNICKLDGSSCVGNTNLITSTSTYARLVKTSDDKLLACAQVATAGLWCYTFDLDLTNKGVLKQIDGGVHSYIDIIEGSDNKIKVTYSDNPSSFAGTLVSCDLDGSNCGTPTTFIDSRANAIVEFDERLYVGYSENAATTIGELVNFNLTGGDAKTLSVFSGGDGVHYIDIIATTDNTLVLSYTDQTTSKGMFAISEAFPSGAVITINTPVDTSSTNTTSIPLNVSTDINTDLSYILNGASEISICTSCNTSTNLTLTGVEGLNNLTILSNLTGELTNTTSTFTVDTTLPVINNNILSEYNSYTFDFNSSCTDTNLVSCNISIDSQDVALNSSSFTSTLNGNISYTITAIDSVGNTLVENGNVFINPYINLYFNNSVLSTALSDFSVTHSTGDYSTNNTLLQIKTYDLGLGNNSLVFNKFGFENETFYVFINESSIINLTTLIAPVTMSIMMYDSDSLAQLTFDVSIYNSTDSVSFTSQTNFSKDYDEVPGGDITIVVSSANYSDATFYADLTPFTSISIEGYLFSSLISEVYTFSVEDSASADPLENVLVEIQQLINGTFLTLSQKYTAVNGVAFFYLDPANEYNVIFTKDDYVSATASTIPTVKTYSVRLLQTSVAFEYIDELSYSFTPSGEMLNDNITYPFTSFISGSSITYMEWVLKWGNGSTIYSDTSTNPSGNTFSYDHLIPLSTNQTKITSTLTYFIDAKSYTVEKTYIVISFINDSFLQTAEDFGASTEEDTVLFRWIIMMILIMGILIMDRTLGMSGVNLMVIPLFAGLAFVGWLTWTIAIAGGFIAMVLYIGGKR